MPKRWPRRWIRRCTVSACREPHEQSRFRRTSVSTSGGIMLRTHLVPFAAALALGAGFAGAAPAGAEEKSCVDQIEELCGATEPNSPARRSCVKDKRSKLSEECQKRLGPPGPAPAKPAAGSVDSARQLQLFFETCRPDQAKIAKLCTGERAQGDALLQCISEHESEVSKACADIAKRSRKPAATQTAPAK